MADTTAKNSPSTYAKGEDAGRFISKAWQAASWRHAAQTPWGLERV
jgi:hypothetical protein